MKQNEIAKNIDRIALLTNRNKINITQQKLANLRYSLYHLIKECKNVALYDAIGSEPSTDYLHIQLKKNGCNTLYPRFKGSQVELCPVNDTGNMIKGDLDILEPTTPAVRIVDVDLVICPGIAFDVETGRRLGYGRELYDCLLKEFEGIKIGVVWDEMIKKIYHMTKKMCLWIL